MRVVSLAERRSAASCCDVMRRMSLEVGEGGSFDHLRCRLNFSSARHRSVSSEGLTHKRKNKKETKKPIANKKGGWEGTKDTITSDLV